MRSTARVVARFVDEVDELDVDEVDELDDAATSTATTPTGSSRSDVDPWALHTPKALHAVG